MVSAVRAVLLSEDGLLPFLKLVGIITTILTGMAFFMIICMVSSYSVTSIACATTTYFELDYPYWRIGFDKDFYLGAFERNLLGLPWINLFREHGWFDHSLFHLMSGVVVIVATFICVAMMISSSKMVLLYKRAVMDIRENNAMALRTKEE